MQADTEFSLLDWQHVKYTDPNITEIGWFPFYTKEGGSVVFDYTTSRLDNNFCFYMNPYLQNNPQQNMSIAFHDMIHKARAIEDKFFPEKPTVRNRLIFHNACFFERKPVTAELLYNGICDRIGGDLHPNDILYINFTGECFMGPTTYKILKTFLKLCGETKVVFMTFSINGLITSRTTKRLFSDHPNFYLLCGNDWIASTEKISVRSNKDLNYQKRFPKSKTFLAIIGCLRPQRLVATAKLAVDGLLQHGHVSWQVPELGYNYHTNTLQLPHENEEFTHPDYEILASKFNVKNLPSHKYMTQLTKTSHSRILDPFTIPEDELDCHHDAYIYFVPETQYWNSNQTLFEECEKLYDNQGNFYTDHKHVYSFPANFFSEKTWKPMGYKMPFIIMGTPYNLQSLREYGFKTFDPWIDETYDTIEDDYLRLDAITKELQRLTDNPPDENWMMGVKEICEHNFQLLCEYNGSGPVTLLNNNGEIIKTDLF